MYDVEPVLHPSSELRYINPSIGYGVFATRFIPKGTITWVFDELDQVVEVPPALTMRERRRSRALGKSHPTDAVAIARITAREDDLPPVDPAGFA